MQTFGQCDSFAITMPSDKMLVKYGKGNPIRCECHGNISEMVSTVSCHKRQDNNSCIIYQSLSLGTDSPHHS